MYPPLNRILTLDGPHLSLPVLSPSRVDVLGQLEPSPCCTRRFLVWWIRLEEGADPHPEWLVGRFGLFICPHVTLGCSSPNSQARYFPTIPSFLLTNSWPPSTLSSPSTATPRIPLLLQARRPRDNISTIPSLAKMHFMEMWWVSVPFAVVLCLVLSWLSTGDDDLNIHESGIMRVSLRTFCLPLQSLHPRRFLTEM